MSERISSAHEKLDVLSFLKVMISFGLMICALAIFLEVIVRKHFNIGERKKNTIFQARIINKDEIVIPFLFIIFKIYRTSRKIYYNQLSCDTPAILAKLTCNILKRKPTANTNSGFLLLLRLPFSTTDL